MEEVKNSEVEDSEREDAKVEEEGSSPNPGAEKLKTVDLTETEEDCHVEDEKLDEENVVNVVEMETGEKPIEKKPEPLSEAELSRAKAEMLRTLYTGQRFVGVSLPLRAETRIHQLLAPVYQLAAAGKQRGVGTGYWSLPIVTESRLLLVASDYELWSCLSSYVLPLLDLQLPSLRQVPVASPAVPLRPGVGPGPPPLPLLPPLRLPPDRLQGH